MKHNNIKDSQIIFINFEYEEFSFIKDDMDLHNYITKKMTTEEKYYLFFDEIQNVIGWEQVVNSFNYFIGLSENAISYYNNIDIDNTVDNNLYDVHPEKGFGGASRQ